MSAKTQNATTSKRIHSVTIKRMVDEDPDASYLEQENMGFEDRLRQYRGGQFWFIGICAEAYIGIPADGPGQTGSRDLLGQTISSGGLWGIESDSDASYLEEIEQEQLDELRGQLHALGFSKRAISAAFRNVEHKEA